MEIQNNRQIALSWIEAFNAADLDRLLGLYHQDAIHFSPKLKARQPETKGWIKGNDELRKWWAEAFNRLPSLKYHLKNLIISNDQILIEYLRTVDGEEDMMIAEILEIKDELIHHARVYHS